MTSKPFIKYAGGKTKLSEEIVKQFPQKYNNYHEPFVGGGAIFFKVIGYEENIDDKKFFINDINEPLMNCYKMIKNNKEGLIRELSKTRKYYNTEECYYKNRKRFNNIKTDTLKNVERAGLYIYLNKFSFNGMYRENKNGEFNIPFGKVNNQKICDIENIESVSKSLKNVKIESKSYLKVLQNSKKGDLVYFDPPYYKNFTMYTKDGFEEKDQIMLKKIVDDLTKKGVYVILSNSNELFIKKLYDNYDIKIMNTSHTLNPQKNVKNNKKEVLIKNFY